jgi:hypothetical protein
MVQEDTDMLALLMAEVCTLSEGVQEVSSTQVVLDETRDLVNLGRDVLRGIMKRPSGGTSTRDQETT